MPTILSRLRGLIAPTALDEPLRLGDAGGVSGGSGSGHDGGGTGGKRSGDGPRGRLGMPGRRGLPGYGRPLGAYFVAPFGGAVTVPVNAVENFINAQCTLRGIYIATKGGPGTCQLSLWKSNFVTGHYPPVIGDDITGGVNPSIIGGSTYINTTLSGYITTFSEDDLLLIGLVSSSGFTSVEISLKVK